MRTPHNERLSSASVKRKTGGARTSGRRAARAAARGETPAVGGALPGDAGVSGEGLAGEGPERRCILTGEIAGRDELIRLAISPDGPDGVAMVLPDVLARAPGRGAWIGISRTDLEIALAKGKLKAALARAHKGAKLAIPENLPDLIETALIRAFTERLGLSLRSGQLLMGSDRIAEKARAGRVTWLAHASDAGTDGSRKLDQAWRMGRDAEGSGLHGITLPLDRASLSVALGRENVVHLALTDRGASERLAPLLARLLHFLNRPVVAGQVSDGNPVAMATAGADDDVLI